jgi:glycosyltransferase involved in cell wall biosynthesis
MSTTKVLHVIARMNVGGTSRYVSQILEKIDETTLATGHVQGHEIEDKCMDKLTFIRIPHLGRTVSLRKDFQAFLELRKVIRTEKPEIVHTHTFKAGLIGRLIGGEHHRFHTFHGHLFKDTSFSYLRKLAITLIEKLLAKRTDLLISVGKEVGKEIRDAGIGKNKPWISIAPGVDALEKVKKEAARNFLGLETKLLLVGWMARVTSVKNPKLLIDVAKKLPNVQFVLAGGGDQYEFIKLNAPENVRVIGWTNSSMFWSAVDIGISTSENEGMPIALIEAQLAGIPVVATDVGATSEVIKDGVTGILVSTDANLIANALHKLVFDTNLAKAMGAAARDHAATEFNSQKMINKHKEIYSKRTL